MKWALLPQVQPMRALLFVTVIAQFSRPRRDRGRAIARRYLEAFAWFALAYLVPLEHQRYVDAFWNRALGGRAAG
jgi:hypothetical protein